MSISPAAASQAEQTIDTLMTTFSVSPMVLQATVSHPPLFKCPELGDEALVEKGPMIPQSYCVLGRGKQ